MSLSFIWLSIIKLGLVLALVNFYFVNLRWIYIGIHDFRRWLAVSNQHALGGPPINLVWFRYHFLFRFRPLQRLVRIRQPKDICYRLLLTRSLWLLKVKVIDDVDLSGIDLNSAHRAQHLLVSWAQMCNIVLVAVLVHAVQRVTRQQDQLFGGLPFLLDHIVGADGTETQIVTHHEGLENWLCQGWG